MFPIFYFLPVDSLSLDTTEMACLVFVAASHWAFILTDQIPLRFLLSRLTWSQLSAFLHMTDA